MLSLAVGTRIVVPQPIGDARLAKQFLALGVRALDGIVDSHVANHAK